MTLEFMNTCAKCGTQFAADQDWKSICLPCYKQGWRQRKDGGLYQVAPTTPRSKNNNSGGGLQQEILDTLKAILAELRSNNV